MSGSGVGYTKETLLQAIQARTKYVNDCWLFDTYPAKMGYKGKNYLVSRLSLHISHNFDIDSRDKVKWVNNCIGKKCWNPEHLVVEPYPMDIIVVRLTIGDTCNPSKDEARSYIKEKLNQVFEHEMGFAHPRFKLIRLEISR